ncbi:S-layer domain-containing protein [Crinalium epipsammum PCC 9333]|uniref:S-layer domain-containing protein n=1 Tax=Crinalium epipsammum PCC 9333 TaxID=1173022 RepID=K9VUG7_9CYAN|nr:S-layer homology domain-containing protein [Crinalium epipsammum]AFZ11209.1 S-layer domain-containing protein [Crinalium epipsammum PCC 9333]
MSNLNRWKSATALLISLGLTTGTVTPIVAPLLLPTPAFAQSTSFSDVPSNYWANDFIQALAARNIIAGFTDGTFRPETPVTRAQFAAMISKAFQQSNIRTAVNFVDVPSNYWATGAIRDAYEMGFLTGYPGNVFRPNQNIPREQVLVSLANGLNLTASGSTSNSLNLFTDATDVSNYARNSIAVAAEKGLVVSYPNVSLLNPRQTATRAEVAAFIYQALVNSGQAQAITSPYIVSQNSTPNPTPTTPSVPTNYRISSGTNIPTNYDKERILLTPNESVPLTLKVAANITTREGRVLIPAESQVAGQLQPGEGGVRFVAQTLIMPDGTQMPINAISSAITKTQTVTKGANVGTLIRNAALGAGAAAAITGVTGDRTINTGEVLGGAGIGTLLGLFLGRDRVDLVVVEPNTDLNLQLTQDLVVNAR